MNVVMQMIEDAIANGKEKAASWSPPVTATQPSPAEETPHWQKVASACGALADSLEVSESPRQKLAEMLALYEKVTEGGPEVSAATTTGTSLEPNQSGKAKDQPPTRVSLEGSKLPDTLHAAPGGVSQQKVALMKEAWLNKLASEGSVDPKVAFALVKKAQKEQKNVAGAVVKGLAIGPKGVAKQVINNALSKKAAEDSGAVINAGTEPVITPYGVGEKAPMPPNPKGRHLGSAEAVANATKGDLKNPDQDMAPYLDHTGSSNSDTVLSTQLDNTSSKDVKLASVKAYLNKWARESPDNAEKLAQAIQTHAPRSTALGDVASEHSLDDVYSALGGY